MISFIARNKYKIAWIVLVLSVLLSVFVRFPSGFYDEQIHYMRAKGVANGQLLSYSKEGDPNTLGHDIDRVGVDYIHNYHYSDRTAPVSTEWLFDEVGSASSSSEDVYVATTSAAPYSPVPYLSYAVASKAAQVTGSSLRGEFLAMRLAGAIVSLSLVFLAFRISPEKYKWVVMAVALIPMSVAAFAAVSIDGFTIATSLLFMATIASMVSKMRSDKLSNRDIALVAGASILVVFAKMPAFLLIAILLAIILIFRKKISKRHKLYLVSIIAVTALITLAWAMYAKGINTGAYWGRDVDTLEQLKFIASNPLLFLRNLIFSMLNYNISNIVYVGYANHQLLGSLPFTIDMVVLVGIALGPFLAREQKKPVKEEKSLYWCQLALFVAICASIFTLLYLQFTPIGTPNHIDGVQPRYFIPFIPLLVMIPFTMRLSRSVRAFAYVAPFAGLAFYAATLIVQII